MEKSNFWIITLCALLAIANMSGWSILLRITVAANALVVLFDVARNAWTLFHRSEEV